jgi:hypothetical protein
MKTTRIYINGHYNENDTMTIEVVEQKFTGEGAADFKNNVIFKGTKEFKGIANMEEMSDKEFNELENTIQKSLKNEFAQNSNEDDFYYFVS